MRWSHVYKVDGGRRLNRAVYGTQPLDSVYHVYRLLEVYRLPPSTTVYLVDGRHDSPLVPMGEQTTRLPTWSP